MQPAVTASATAVIGLSATGLATPGVSPTTTNTPGGNAVPVSYSSSNPTTNTKATTPKTTTNPAPAQQPAQQPASQQSAPAPTPTPAPAPAATSTPAPAPTPMPDGAPANPWGYDFEPGNAITAPPSNFCSYYNCIANFANGKGHVEECKDAMYSLSGGVSGSCSGYSGNNRELYSH